MTAEDPYGEPWLVVSIPELAHMEAIAEGSTNEFDKGYLYAVKKIRASGVEL